MKKTRLVSFLLAMLMIVTAVCSTGCSDEKTSSEGAATTKTVETLNMYIMTDDATKKEEADKVEMAINYILLPTYKTILNINYITYDEYYDTIEALYTTTKENNSAQSVIQKAKPIGFEGKGFTSTIEEMFRTDRTSIELDKDQLDILVIDDYDKYVEYANKGMLKGMTSYLTYESKILNTSVHPTFMAAAKVGSETYGVPTNAIVDAGEYTYIVYNENLLEKYGVKIARIREFGNANFTEYCATIKANEPDVWPVSGPVTLGNAEFYDGESFVVLHDSFGTLGSYMHPSIVMSSYISAKTAEIEYVALGYYPTEEVGEDAKFAIKVERSSELLTDNADKRWIEEDGTVYTRMLYDIPRVSVEEAFTSVMSISSTSPLPDRAMEVITLFQTNSELANLLQYGVEGVHYQVNQLDGSIAPLVDTYKMNNLTTGNTYIKYPEDNDPDYLEKAINANLSVAPSGTMGMSVSYKGSDFNKYELVKFIIASAEEAARSGKYSYADAATIALAELKNIGYSYTETVERTPGEISEGNFFAPIQTAQKASIESLAGKVAVANEIIAYNDFIFRGNAGIEPTPRS